MTDLAPRHPIPPATRRWGYDHCPDVWRKADVQWESVTAGGSVVAGLVRLVSGRRATRSGATYSRGPDSWISLDTFSIGIAHWWAETAPKLLARLAVELPALARWAWGPEAGEALQNPSWIRSLPPLRERTSKQLRGKRPHDPLLDWLLAGWHEIARHPLALRLQVDHWLMGYVPAALHEHSRRDWGRADTLAALVRVSNSRGSGGMKRLLARAEQECGAGADEVEVCRTLYAEDLYGHPERWALIRSMPEFTGVAPSAAQITADVLDWDVPVWRHDGTKPAWVSSGVCQ